MQALKQYCHLEPAAHYAVVIADFDCAETVDPDWPELIFCDTRECAELLSNTLNAVSFRDCSEFLLSEEPFLDKEEIKRLWIELKAARYSVQLITEDLLSEH